MVIEVIKRKQKMGYIGDSLVYKVPMDQPSPEVLVDGSVVTTEVVAEETPAVEEPVVGE